MPNTICSFLLKAEAEKYKAFGRTVLTELPNAFLLDRYSESRDKNLDIYSAKQVIVSMPSVLREITGRHHTLMLTAIRKEIKKGHIARKYYYIDLNGKKHTNYNSEASRDKAVEDYIKRLYTEFSENGDGMFAMADNIERCLSGYSVFS